MAKYIPIENGTRWTYALAECEDYLLLDAYLAIKAAKRFNEKPAIRQFEHYYLGRGGTINDETLLAFNGFLALMGRDPIALVNGHTTSYAGLRDFDKVIRRESIMEKLNGLTFVERANLIDLKRAEAKGLPERNPFSHVQPPAKGEILQRNEVEMRRAALAQALKGDLAVGRLSIPAGDEPIGGHPVKQAKSRVSLDNLAAMRQRIAAAEGTHEPDAITMREAVAAMFDDIEAARKRGVTWDRLAADLADLGVTSAKTLEKYHMAGRRERGITRVRKEA